MSAKTKIAIARAKVVIKDVSFKLFLVSIGVVIGGSGVFISLKAPAILDVPPLIFERAEAAKLPLDRVSESVAPKSGLFYTYNAEESQTDGNPYRTANGKIVKDGIVANNCLPFGTKIDVDGVGVLEVQDRMNDRYGCDDFDVFRENPAENFKKTIQYQIL